MRYMERDRCEHCPLSIPPASLRRRAAVGYPWNPESQETQSSIDSTTPGTTDEQRAANPDGRKPVRAWTDHLWKGPERGCEAPARGGVQGLM